MTRIAISLPVCALVAVVFGVRPLLAASEQASTEVLHVPKSRLAFTCSMN